VFIRDVIIACKQGEKITSVLNCLLIFKPVLQFSITVFISENLDTLA